MRMKTRAATAKRRPPAAPEAETWELRQAAIREILGRHTIESQGEVVDRLAARGFAVTQSSVSRDLAELRAAKVEGRYLLPEMLGDAARPRTARGHAGAAAFLRSVRPIGAHFLVVRATPGAANTVGIAIDEAAWPEVAGTLAGDDTLLVMTAGKRDQARVRARLEAWLAGKKS